MLRSSRQQKAADRQAKFWLISLRRWRELSAMYEMSDYELNSTEAVFQTGMDLLESNHFEEAVQAFDYVVEQQPFNADAIFHRGVALLNLGRNDDALTNYQNALEIAPTDALYHSHCGYALLASSRPEEAIRHFDSALELQPDWTHPKIYKACALAERRWYGMACRLLDEVLREHPGEIEALRHHSAILAATGKEKQALQQIARILKLNPNHREALRNKAFLLLRLGRREEAIRSLRELTSVDPDDSGAWEVLLQALSMDEQWPQVIALSGSAIEWGKENPELFVFRGRALLERGSTEEAIADLRHALKLNEHIPEAQYLLARAHLSKGQHQPALEAINCAIRIMPNERPFLLLKAELHGSLGDYEAEFEVYNYLIRLWPEDFDLVMRKVNRLVASNRLKEAAACASDFLKRFPAHPDALLAAAELHAQLGSLVIANKYFERLMKTSATGEPAVLRAYCSFLIQQDRPDLALDLLEFANRPDAGIEVCRGAALQKLGRHEDCIRAMQAAVSANLDCPELRWLLGRSLFACKEYNEALEQFRIARQTGGPGSERLLIPELVVCEASALARLGRAAEAVELMYRHFAQFANSDERFCQTLGELHEQLDEHARAGKIYRQALRHFPHAAGLHYRLARLCAAEKNKPSALRHLRTAVSLDRSIRDLAVSDKLFRQYALSPSLIRILASGIVTRRFRLAAILAAWSLGVTAAAYFYQP